MSERASGTKYDRETILRELIGILEDMTGDWEVSYDGGIGPDTRLIADLGLESIDVVQLVVAIEEHFGRRDLPFGELLMEDGRYVDDLRIGDAADFLAKHLSA
jgi:acyl carrier protein